jgi:hypothetical protein
LEIVVGESHLQNAIGGRRNTPKCAIIHKDNSGFSIKMRKMTNTWKYSPSYLIARLESAETLFGGSLRVLEMISVQRDDSKSYTTKDGI